VLGSTIAGLGFGFLADRYGTRFLPAMGMALLIASMWLAAVASPGWVAVTYAVVLGAMGGGIRTLAATLLPTWFGTAHLGSIQGSLTFFNVGATAIGPVVLAVTQSWLGAYPPAVMLLSLIPAAALVFSLGRDRHRRPLAH
jgi:MFS family permease